MAESLAKTFAGRRVLITGGAWLHRFAPGAAAGPARRGGDAGRQHDPRVRRQPAQPGRDRAAVHLNISDVRDAHSLPHFVRGQDFLFNLAGQTSHMDSMTDPQTDLEINARAQLSILEACRRHNPGIRIVFASTRQIYGRPDYLPVDETASAAAGRRERHQQAGRRVLSSSLPRGAWHPQLRAAADQHDRAGHAGEGRAADLPRRLAPLPAGEPAVRSLGRRTRSATSPMSTMRSRPSCSRRRRRRRPAGSSTSAAGSASACATSPTCWSRSTAADGT